jgi:NADH-quinone oxidoreductase subunit E
MAILPGQLKTTPRRLGSWRFILTDVRRRRSCRCCGSRRTRWPPRSAWLPVPVIEHIARQLGMPYIRVYEVASFYTMYNLAPVGRFHVQVCGTTPCQLRGSDDVMRACRDAGLVKGGNTPDGLFTLSEVECLGACANAPMVQINADNYEDLTYDSMTAVLAALARGETPETGSQIGRTASCPQGGATTLISA